MIRVPVHHGPGQRFAGLALATLLSIASLGSARAEGTVVVPHEPVRVMTDDSGYRLQVNGRDIMVRGMNWDYIPIGQNYAYNLWEQPEPMIRSALDREMGLMAGMGVNAIRVYVGIPPKWVSYIHDRYGIYCIINHTVARYGFSLDGVWNPSVDYSNPRMRAAVAADVAASLAPYKGVPGVLMYLLGNENNYGLVWSSFEIEALPKGERDTKRARYLYSLFGEIIRSTKAADPEVPVAIANGDVQYIDLIAEECKGLDVFGTNVYRGISARDMFKVVKDKLGVPLLFTEFGSDAFNARSMREDQGMQAHYLIGQWREIYEQSAGHGGEGSAIGGLIFQWSDGWWKNGQDVRLDQQDPNASWPNEGYPEDFTRGENNMNEEWWGICAKGRADAQGQYELYPRAAYYAMRQAFALDAYAPTTTREVIQQHFSRITPAYSVLEARGDQASLAGEATQRARLSGVRAQFETISTGASLTRPPVFGDPAFRGFDKMQTFYTDFQASPTPAVNGRLSLNFRGNVPTNTIDQIFYENRSTDRVKVYQSSVTWDDRWFLLDAFYRTGHYHWGYEGDFFGLYREANYGPNLDIYDAEAPVGVEMAMKRSLTGLKLAYGPQLWWGAPPAIMAKYRRQVGRFDATSVLERDVQTVSGISFVGSSTTVIKPTSKATLHLKTNYGPFTIEGGGIWAGANRVDETFPVAIRSGNSYKPKLDRIRSADALGMKFRVAGARGKVQWYAQGASMGLVAEGGPTGTATVTGWGLKDTGLGNQNNFLTGFAYNAGHLQLAPNFMWQKPIVGAIPTEATEQKDIYRENFNGPFSVRGNREMTAAELLLSYDPTPGTWLYAWDNDIREDSHLAGSISFTYRHMPSNMDPAVGIFQPDEALLYGTQTYVFDGSTPPRDLWELKGRAVSRVSSKIRVMATAFYGTGEPNLTPDPRLVTRYGGDVKMTSGTMSIMASAKFNDWGPYDYMRDFNLTYPIQLMGDVSHTLGSPMWFETNPQTKIGARVLYRTLDRYGVRYIGIDGDPDGTEWEVRTYLKLAM